jgi:hypothetical protein
MPPLVPSTWLQLQRSVRFGDTDAAGVMHFHQLLRWCHEAYEESLERFGLPAASVFPRPAWAGDSPGVALPIVYCQAEFHRPLLTGDQLLISLRPEALQLRAPGAAGGPGPDASSGHRRGPAATLSAAGGHPPLAGGLGAGGGGATRLILSGFQPPGTAPVAWSELVIPCPSMLRWSSPL